VLELDGASNRGIDDIRHIKESVYYAPQELSKKVIIIDECHKLTSEAFTALLKIIEEPPPYVHFILCTTDYRKVPKPIISRCQRFNFVKIPSKLMAERLAKVAEREKIKLSDGVALAISRVADGSLRDGLGFLEQIAASSSGEVTMEAAMHFFGMAERRVIYEMAGMILDRNISGVLYKVNELIVASVDIKTILIDISEVFRNVFLAKTVGTDTHLLDLNKDELDLIASWAAKLSTGSLLRIASSFSKIEKEITFNINERWILEAALVNCILILNAEEKVSDSSAVANR
jgi:DNA polymerase-3 subunit gamma/tau